MKAGDRVGAVLSADKKEVRFLGWGTYEGDFIPDEGFLFVAGVPNPRIKLDNGTIVWGYQCWWGAEDRMKEWVEGRKIVEVVIDQDEQN